MQRIDAEPTMPIDPPPPVVDGATFHAIFRNSLDAILLTDPHGQIVLANPAACRLLGRSEEEIQRLGRTGLLDATDERLALALEERARTRRFSGELRMLNPDGSAFPVEITSALFTDDRGETRTCTVIRDISQRQAEELARSRASRLVALRELSMGIRHEVNNSLAALRGELQLLQGSRTLAPDDREGVVAALAIGDRIAAAIRRLEHVELLDLVDYLGTTRMIDLSPEAPASANGDSAVGTGDVSVR